jgi:hypothetical protein
LDKPATASSSIAHTCSLASALHASATPSDDPWVIYFDAFDHMTDMSPLFSLYNPCSWTEKSRITDGSLSPSKGFIYVTPPMTLSSVLHLPDFAVNLLSIARITLELNR